MLYNQPLANRFGTDLIAHLTDPKWKRFDVAVAWVRSSGVTHLTPSLTSFLRNGNKVSLIVGVDLDNTSYEGLKGFLNLSKDGDIEIFIHHNEANVVFHPKLYMLSNHTEAKLIVCSNNITESGLYRNTEAGLEINLPINNATVVAAQNALKTWSDITTPLARRLDTALLNELLAEGYIQKESVARKSMAARVKTAKKARTKSLFGSKVVTAPVVPPKTGLATPAPAAPPTAATGTPTTSTVGSTLIMRIRKAHVTDRPTQTQIPLRVVRTGFFSGFTNIVSTHTGQPHAIHEAHARGIINTLKLEVPEMRTFADPVIRFERTPTGISYEVYDATTPGGATIIASLNAGRTSTPPTTGLTLPADPVSSTWWRFI